MNDKHDTEISRRRLALGLAAIPLAALPAAAGAGDPVLTALADLDRFRAEMLHPIGERFGVAERAYLSSEPRTKPLGYDELEQAWGDATGDELDYVRGVLAANPATMAGAVALLQFIARDRAAMEAPDEIREACAAVAGFLAGASDRVGV